MARPILDPDHQTAEVAAAIEGFHADVVARVREAVGRDDLVVVGMAQNPYVKKVRKALDDASVTYTYLELGSYTSQWKQRLAIKLWSGWPTFPQVFVKGVLLGGNEETRHALRDGTLRKRIEDG